MEKCCSRLYLDAFAIVKVNVLAIDQLFRCFQEGNRLNHLENAFKVKVPFLYSELVFDFFNNKR